jgi:hypothetical protein
MLMWIIALISREENCIVISKVFRFRELQIGMLD